MSSQYHRHEPAATMGSSLLASSSSIQQQLPEQQIDKKDKIAASSSLIVEETSTAVRVVSMSAATTTSSPSSSSSSARNDSTHGGVLSGKDEVSRDTKNNTQQEESPVATAEQKSAGTEAAVSISEASPVSSSSPPFAAAVATVNTPMETNLEKGGKSSNNNEDALSALTLLAAAAEASPPSPIRKNQLLSATTVTASTRPSSSCVNISKDEDWKEEQQQQPPVAVGTPATGTSLGTTSLPMQEQQDDKKPAAETVTVSSPPPPAAAAAAASSSQQQQQPPQSQPAASSKKRPPPSSPAAAASTTTSTTTTTTTTNKQTTTTALLPREEASFDSARPCMAHTPTLEELQSQSFSDYVRNVVLRAALPPYRPEQEGEYLYAANNSSSSTTTAGRAAKKKKTTKNSAVAAAAAVAAATAATTTGAESQSMEINQEASNEDADEADNENKKVILIEPDWTIHPMPLTQGMAKVTLPQGFWSYDGIGHDTTGRGPAWQAGTELGDIVIHSPIQQHVRGMAGIYEYTFMDQSSMTIAEFRKAADDYQEAQIPASLSLRKRKPLRTKKKPKKKAAAAAATATVKPPSPVNVSATHATMAAASSNTATTTTTTTTSPDDDSAQKKALDSSNEAPLVTSTATSTLVDAKNAAVTIPVQNDVAVANDTATASSLQPAAEEEKATSNSTAKADESNANIATDNDDAADPSIHEYSDERIHKLEEKFWKRLGPTMPPSIYGADQEATLFGDDPASGWSLADLDSCLHVLPKDVPGVTSPYLYVGMWASVFCAHAEDMNLFSINYLHAGAPKIWYAIAPGPDAKRFESLCEFHFLHGSSASAARPPMTRMGPSPSASRKRKKQGSAPGASNSGGKAQYCKEFLRHKRSLLSPKILQRAGIGYTTTIQRPGEAVITMPSGYHFGFNVGFNLAEATNFAVPEWIPYGLKANVCLCRPDSVRIDMTRLIQLLQLYQKDADEHAAALAKPGYKKKKSAQPFLSWKEWREWREWEKEKRQSKKKKQQQKVGTTAISSSIKNVQRLMAESSADKDKQKRLRDVLSDQQRKNEFWIEVVKPVAKKDRPQIQLASLAGQLGANSAAAAKKVDDEERKPEPIILEGKRKRKKSAKAAALEQEEKERLLEKQQRQKEASQSAVDAAAIVNGQETAPDVVTEEIWHLAKPVLIPASGARSKQRRRLELHTRVLCLLPGTVMASDNNTGDVDNVNLDDDDNEEEDEQCFAGQVVEISDDYVLIHMDGLPRSEAVWMPIASPKLFLDGGRWKDDNNMADADGQQGDKNSRHQLPKLHYWQVADSKERCPDEDDEEAQLC